MPVEVRWVNADKNALLIQAIYPWDWQESNEAKKQMDILLEAVTHPVDLIIDLTQAHRVPPNTISGVNQMMMSKPPHVRRVILVGLNSFFQIIVSIIIRLYPDFQPILVLTNTLESALQLLPAADNLGAS